MNQDTFHVQVPSTLKTDTNPRGDKLKTNIDGTDVKLYEAALTQDINLQLKEYVQNDLQLDYISYMSESTDQNFADLDRHCSDLVSKIGDIRALSLEVKVKAGDYLPAFKREQHQGLLALAKAGVPVYYAYNNFSMKDGEQPDSVALTDYSGCSPVELPGRNPDSDKHVNLKQLVDGIKATGATFDAAVYAFAVKNIASISSFEASQLNTKSLLLIYNKSLGQLMAFDEPAAKRFIREFKAQAIKAASKDSLAFVSSLNAFTVEVDKALAEAKRQFQNVTLYSSVSVDQTDDDDWLKITL